MYAIYHGNVTATETQNDLNIINLRNLFLLSHKIKKI